MNLRRLSAKTLISLFSLNTLQSVSGYSTKSPLSALRLRLEQSKFLVLPSRSNEKERSELKGGFRGIVYMNGGVFYTTTILKATKTSQMEGLCDYMK